ncbi:MAG: hydantoinase/oxoprolinase family protein [Methylobacteriaceae bacterium]|nr:hydantoinase/oxoprolinase family protein [Methylobacteriaceae bacterium]
MALRIGIDSGGTFTDVCLFDDATGEVAVWKVPSTPDDPSRAIAEGTRQGVERIDRAPRDLAYFGHGTTVGTNALIQHRGVRTGLVTTDGFRDLIEIGRQKRPDLYDLQADKPPPLVTRDLRFGVAERLRHDGSVETPLDESAMRAIARRLKDADVKAVAVGFLYGFVRPDHENRARAILLEEIPDAFVTTSHEVAPEFREYERISTAVVNAYLGPVMRGYITRLAARLRDLGVTAVPHLTQSNGGVIGFDMAARLPVRTVLSGPSTGVVAAQAIGAMIGMRNLITFDMGGTSTDVALLRDGEASVASEATVHGYPIKAPMLDIHTVGAGGGSIAHIDSGGLLKVGPRSCGADPGPVCYDRGATEPATTDANVVLQTLNPRFLLGGRMPIVQDKARHAIGALAEQLGLDVMSTAQGVISVVTANMAKAIRVISVQRGHDPRDYALVAFGGAGPLHAARLARELEMKTIVVPRHPGICCALGLLLTDLRADFAATQLMLAEDGATGRVADIYANLELQARAWFAEEHVADKDQRLRRIVDMRYHGQNYEIPIDLAEGPVTSGSLGQLRVDFAEAHRRLYGYAAEEEPIQMVTFRVAAIGAVVKAAFRPEPDAGPDPSHARIGEREVWFPEAQGFIACPVYDRDKLKAGNRIEGPAIVEQMDATTVLLPGMRGRVEPYLNLILEMP